VQRAQRRLAAIVVADVAGEHKVKNITRPVQTWRRPTAAAGETHSTAEDPLPLPTKPSIAVLLFNSLSSDPEQEFFADGIVEDLITALSRFPWLFVIARNSSFSYKGEKSSDTAGGRRSRCALRSGRECSDVVHASSGVRSVDRRFE
jgi:hypothetical protein